MQITLHMSNRAIRQSFERRAEERMTIALPILIAIGRTRYNALVHDLSSEGAMIETIAPLLVNSQVEIHCGSILTSGVVLWQGGNKFGIRFSATVTDRQVGEQVTRSNAVAAWRKRVLVRPDTGGE